MEKSRARRNPDRIMIIRYARTILLDLGSQHARCEVPTGVTATGAAQRWIGCHRRIRRGPPLRKRSAHRGGSCDDQRVEHGRKVRIPTRGIPTAYGTLARTPLKRVVRPLRHTVLQTHRSMRSYKNGRNSDQTHRPPR